MISRRDHQSSVIGSRLDEHRASQVQQRIQLDETTTSEILRYEQFALNITHSGMIQSTIYHIRQEGKNIYDPDEQEKYYSDDFLFN